MYEFLGITLVLALLLTINATDPITAAATPMRCAVWGLSPSMRKRKPHTVRANTSAW